MEKKLSEMTLEELWRLFPIRLTEHKAYWADWYAEEARGLKKILPKDAEIFHIGSTAIDGIWAKPIVDILVEISDNVDLSQTAKIISEHGYIIMSQSANRISLNKGYTESGFAEKVYHLHLQYNGDKNEVLFRDYLNAHPEAAREYESLKLKLWKEFEFNRDAYTEAKSDFVKKYTDMARREYLKR